MKIFNFMFFNKKIKYLMYFFTKTESLKSSQPRRYRVGVGVLKHWFQVTQRSVGLTLGLEEVLENLFICE